MSKHKWFPGFRNKAHAVKYKWKASWLTRLKYCMFNQEYVASCEYGMITACGKVIWCSPEEVKRTYKKEQKCKTCLRVTEKNC